MSAVWMRARAEMRARWRSVVVLSLLLAVATGAVLTSAAGARRTATSYERLLDASLAYDVAIDLVGDVSPDVLDDVASLPQVELSGRVAVLPSDSVQDRGSDPEPFEWNLNVGAIIDPGLGHEFEIARVAEGRHADPNEPNEAVASETFLSERGLSVGDSFSFRPLAWPELFKFFGGRSVVPSGPAYSITIVGVWKLPHDVSFTSTPGGILYLTPAFYRAHHSSLATLDLMYVKLRNGEADAASFVRDAKERARAAGDPHGLGFETRSDLVETVRETLSVQALALWLFAGLAGLAALLIVGQAAVRYAQEGARDMEALSALGFSRRGLALAGLIPVAVIGATGAALGALASIGASPLMPIGIGRSVEPEPGVVVDLIVLAVGAVATVVLFLARVAPATVAIARRVPAPAVARVPAAAVVARAGVSESASVGIHLATWRGKGREEIPVRSAVIGSAAGIAALLAAMIFGLSLARLLDSPGEFGWTWDVMVGGGEDQRFVDQMGARAAATSEAGDVAKVIVRHASLDASNFPVFAFEPIRGEIHPRLIEGRLPRSDSEVAVGSAILRGGRSIGERIELPGTAHACGQQPCELPFTIVGRVVTPPLDDSPQDHGGVLTPGGIARLAATTGFSDIAVRFADGVSLEQGLTAFGDSNEVRAAVRPAELENLSSIRRLPLVLAALLAALAVGTLIHALVVSVRRRRRELAILRALGFARRQLVAAIGWQASTLAGLAVVLGIPVGVIAGRLGWNALNGSLGVDVAPVVPAWLLAAVAVGALVVGNIGALGPGRAAARTEAAPVLRSE